MQSLLFWVVKEMQESSQKHLRRRVMFKCFYILFFLKYSPGSELSGKQSLLREQLIPQQAFTQSLPSTETGLRMQNTYVPQSWLVWRQRYKMLKEQ